MPVIKLAKFISGFQTGEGIPFSLKDYLEFTDRTGRSVRSDKKGFIKPETPIILQQLRLDEQAWVETVQSFSTEFHSFSGPESKIKTLCQKQNKSWLKGIEFCHKLFDNKQPCALTI
jgi:hypothetical protein